MNEQISHWVYEILRTGRDTPTRAQLKKKRKITRMQRMKQLVGQGAVSGTMGSRMNR